MKIICINRNDPENPFYILRGKEVIFGKNSIEIIPNDKIENENEKSMLSGKIPDCLLKSKIKLNDFIPYKNVVRIEN